MVWDARAWNGTANFSPLLQAIQGYRQGMDQNFDFRGKQAVGTELASGNMQGARDAAGKYGMDTNVLLTLGEKARQEQERARMAQALQGAESNPDLGRILTPEVRASLAALPPEQRAARIAEYADPIKREQLNIQRQQAARAAADQYGKQGSIVQGADGRYFSVQFGSNGQKIVQPLQFDGQNLTPAKGTDTIGDVIYDKATGKEIRNVAPNIAAGEQAKVIGKEAGEANANWGKTDAAFKQFDTKTNQLLDAITRAKGKIGVTTTGVGGAIMRNVPGTDARALSGDLDTIKSNLGFNELATMRQNSPTGAALGAVSDVENRLLQSTQASVDQLLQGKDLAANLDIIERSTRELSRIQKEKFESDRVKFSTPQQPRVPGQQARPMQQPQATQPNQEAVQMLRSNPALAPQFDEIFGKGAASRVLGGQ